HDVRFLDLCFEEDPGAAAARAVGDFDPEVIGVGLRNLHTNAYDGTEKLVAEYAALVQGLRDLTSVPIVLGGAAYSLQPERLLGELGADYGVVGEGERPFRDVVDALDRGTAPQRITRAPASLREKPRPLRLRRETGLGRPSSTHGWGFAPSDLDEL